MNKFIAAENPFSDPTTIFMILLLVGLVVMMLWSSRRNRARSADAEKMLDELRPGQRVRTYSGVIGRIKEIREETPARVNAKGVTIPAVKTVLLQTGSEKYPAYMLMDIHAIFGIIAEEGHTLDGTPISNLPAPEKQELSPSDTAGTADELAKNTPAKSKKQ